MSIDQIVDYVILVAAVIAAVKQIILPILNSTKFFKDRFKSKKDSIIDEGMKLTIDKISPNIEKIEKQLNEIDRKVSFIEKQDKVKDVKFGELEKSLKNVCDGTKDSLKTEMLKIYYKYLPYSTIATYDRQAFMDMYESYIALGGNTFIKEIKPIIKSWKVVENQTDIEGFNK